MLNVSKLSYNAYTTATVRATPTKNVFLCHFGISYIFRSIPCLSVLELAPAEYATNAFSFK